MGAGFADGLGAAFTPVLTAGRAPLAPVGRGRAGEVRVEVDFVAGFGACARAIGSRVQARTDGRRAE